MNARANIGETMSETLSEARAAVPEYLPRPLAGLMPMMDDDAFANLKADIAKRGIEHPMTTFQGLLLDRPQSPSRC